MQDEPPSAHPPGSAPHPGTPRAAGPENAPPPVAGCPAMAGSRWYKRAHAWVLDRYAGGYNRMVDDRKRRLIGSLRGDVLEIGAGSGANLDYLDRSVHWTAVEPNPFARDQLRRNAADRGITATLLDGTGEALPVPDASQDAVFATLVLCTVADPARTLAEVLRVLRPGGRFVFMEHVAAPPGTATRRWQERVRPAWRWLADGCEPTRDTGGRIRAAGFSSVDLAEFRLPVPIVGPHIAGVAVK